MYTSQKSCSKILVIIIQYGTVYNNFRLKSSLA